MKPLLKHLVELTAHRDHARLEISVIEALRQAAGVPHVRALEIFAIGSEQFVRPKVWTEQGATVSAESDAATDAGRELLSHYPVLRDCIQRREPAAEQVTPEGIHLLWLPVWLDDTVGACLEISQPVAFSPQKREVLQGIFHVYRNYLSLLDYSERDALTGLFNRKTFDEQFAKQALAVQAVPPGGTLARRASDRGEVDAETRAEWLAVVDIDHFKLVNDRFGHLYGDEVLILVANILKSSFRAQDRVFRFGGEEFVVLLRDTTESAARSIFNRFRQTVQQYDFPQVGRVTVSVGFVNIGNGGSAVESLGHADQALYYAKESGRNQVCHYDALVAAGKLRAEASSNDSVELF